MDAPEIAAVDVNAAAELEITALNVKAAVADDGWSHTRSVYWVAGLRTGAP